jgi:membrane associated rhomboid family serine protease
LKEGSNNLSLPYQAIALAVIGVPMCIAQQYLITATGTLTALHSIDEIDQREKTKYYTLDQYALETSQLNYVPRFEIAGKYDEDFVMYLYFTIPILVSEYQTMDQACKAWIGVKYNETISNKLPDYEKDLAYKAFAMQKIEAFETTDFAQFQYLDRIKNKAHLEFFHEAMTKSPRYKSGYDTVFEAVNAPFSERNGNTLAWFGIIFGVGTIGWLCVCLFTELDTQNLSSYETQNLSPEPISEEVQKIEAVKREAENTFQEFIELIRPRRGYFFTPILMILNILVFLVMVFSGLGFFEFEAEDLLKWGGNYRPYTVNGEWWRLLTCIFVHGGLMHVLANMFGLLLVSIWLEEKLGSIKYLLLYLVTGIVASLASLWWYEATVSIGASGAIFGLYGTFLAFLLLKKFPSDFSKSFLSYVSVFIIYNLIVGLMGGTDNAAHIGGLLAGFLIGLAISPLVEKREFVS